MAEFVFREMAEKRGMGALFHAASAATSGEELGNPVHLSLIHIFVSRLHGIGNKEAAILLAQDFAIPYENGAGKTSKPQKHNTDEQNYQYMEQYCFRVLLDYYRLLCRWKEDYAPRTPEDDYHPRFVEALQKLSLVEYLLDELLCGDIQARASVVIEYGEEVRNIEQRMAELAAADEAADQNAGGQYSIADEH